MVCPEGTELPTQLHPHTCIFMQQCNYSREANSARWQIIPHHYLLTT